jgi:hypothetical protein
MKVKVFWKKGCSHCEDLKEELGKLPKNLTKPVFIENENISADDRKTLKMFPTMVFYSDDDRKLKELVGFQDIEKIEDTYKKCNNLIHIQEQYQRMLERDNHAE